MSAASEKTVEKAVDITQTPEFKAAVEAGITAALPSIIAAVRSAEPASPAPVATVDAASMTDLFDRLALSIAQMSNQVNDRKPIAPEILAQREKSRDKMGEAIIFHMGEYNRARAEGDAVGMHMHRPRYKIVGKVYLNERLIDPYTINPVTKAATPTEFYWQGAPNEVMRPVNEAAEEIFGHFKDSIGNIEKKYERQHAWISAGGLVIVGEGPQRRVVNAAEPDEGFQNELEVLGPDGAGINPNKPFINVLGTVHAPARRNAAFAVQKEA